MTREREGHHERPGAMRRTGGIDHHGARAEVHLRRFGGLKVQTDRRIGRARLADRYDQPVHRGVAPRVAVVTAQGCVHRLALHALIEPRGNERAPGCDRGHRGARATRLPDDRGDRLLLGHRALGGEPTLRVRERAKRGGLLAAHQAAARNDALGIAFTQSRENLSVLEHLESPATHRAPPAVKKPGW